MLKVPKKSRSFTYYVALSNVTLVYDEDIISEILDEQDDSVTELESVDGTKIDISSLNCKTYEEFLVALDLNNLLHGGNFLSSDSFSREKIKELTCIIEQLREENAILKEENTVLRRNAKT